jgi:hypothetical protein
MQGMGTAVFESMRGDIYNSHIIAEDITVEDNTCSEWPGPVVTRECNACLGLGTVAKLGLESFNFSCCRLCV